MRPLSVRDILDLGEGDFRGVAGFALEVLARTEAGEDRARDLPVGARDARLMGVRAATFGRRFELFSRCPACDTPVEVALTAEDIGLGEGGLGEAGRGESASPSADRTLRFQDRDLTLRPVTAGDLADAERFDSVEDVRRTLLARCVVAVDGVDGAPVPPGAEAVIETGLEAMDPAAEITLEYACPACGQAWGEVFDAAALLRGDLRDQARRLMAEVAVLARAYHWSEGDILALPPGRRRFYLEAVG
jgi:hypothetical protein